MAERSRTDDERALEALQIGPTLDPDLVHRVTASIVSERLTTHLGAAALPDRGALDELVDRVRELVFPGFFGRRGLRPQVLALHVQDLLARIAILAEEQVRSALRYRPDIGEIQDETPESVEVDRRAREIAKRFLNEIPEIRRLLALDVQASYDGDPAAHHTDETIFCYPGIQAILSHRMAGILYREGVPLIPRIIQEMAHSRTGIDIHPGARIGESFFIDHGGGVVIGETTIIGDHVRIYQGVTLGAKSFERDHKGRMLKGSEKRRHPKIGNRVTIYAGAVILGGDTEIGDDCVISGSVFITESVPPDHMVRQNRPELVLRSQAAKRERGEV